jgi:hypothetical protein
MAKSSEVSPTTSYSISKTNDASLNDLASLRVKEEIIPFNDYVSSVDGAHKLHFESLLSQYGKTLEKLDEQMRLEKEYAHDIASLKDSLEEEERETLEEKLDSIEESNNEVISKLIKERDHARAKVKVLKKEKIEFGVGHDKIVKDLEDLDKAHKALKSEHSILTKSHEQLQIQLTKNDVPSSSTCTCDHANIIEENASLKDELAKSSIPIGEKNLNDLLSKQNTFNDKMGIGFVAKNKKNNKKKKAKPAQAKKDPIVGGKATHDDLAGIANPHYVLFRDYYSDVYAKYIGPNDGYVAWSIWVPKTLVANKRGPIEKWGPKTKQCSLVGLCFRWIKMGA